MSRQMAYPEPITGKCEGCMECVKECPFEAIVVTQLTGEIANFSSSSQAFKSPGSSFENQ